MKKTNKAIPLKLVPERYVGARPGVLLAHVVYDVKKLRRLNYEDLVEVLFEKTLRLYPFASVDKIIKYVGLDRKVAIIPVWMPLTKGPWITITPEGEKENA